MRIPLPIGTYQYADPSVSSRRLLNCTAEAVPDSKSQILVKRMPGIDDFVVAGTGIRGGHSFQGNFYVVSGQSFFKITPDGIVTNIGTITGGKRVFIADNTFEMVIVSEPEGFISDGVTVTQITDSFYVDNGGAKDVRFLDGFFTFVRPDSQIFFNTNLNSTVFDALNFTSADRAADNLVGHHVDHGQLFLAGEKTIELWYDAGLSPGSPFARSPGGLLEIGCASGQTIAKIDETVFWLANDKTVRRLVGNNPTIISKPGIADKIKAQDAALAFGFTYAFEDKFYYVLTFPSLTIEYDVAAQEWHERESRDKDFWLPIDVIEFNGLMALDSSSGNVGPLNSAIKTEWGATQLVQWIYQPVYVEGKRVYHDRLEINMSVGRGVTNGQGSDPEIILLISDNGGSSFSEYQRRGLGKLGERETRVFWQGLGSSYNRVYQCQMSDPVDMFMFDTNLEARV